MKKAPRFFCDNCGTEVPASVDRCPKCGRFFASIRCPKCGFSGGQSDFNKGCPRCGYSAVTNTARGARASRSRQRTPNTALLFVLTSLFILLCAILLMFLTR